MNIVLWIIQGILAAVFLGAGLVKVSTSLEGLARRIGPWVYDVPLTLTRTVGGLEIAAAAGLILPGALKTATSLTGVAAIGLVITMLGAIVIHGRRHETRDVVVNILLAATAVLVAWGRLGPYGF